MGLDRIDFGYTESATGSYIDYSIIEYYRYLNSDNYWELSNSIIRYSTCGTCGARMVVNNLIYGAAHELIDIHDHDAMIVGNEIGPNLYTPEDGGGGFVGINLDLDGGGRVVVQDNLIHDTGSGIHFQNIPAIMPTIEGNVFQNNGQSISREAAVDISGYFDLNTFE